MTSAPKKQKPDVEQVDKEIEEMFESMQSPEQLEATRRLFQMTGEELGDAALRHSKKNRECSTVARDSLTK